MTKTYELEIESAVDSDSGPVLAYFSKGHQDKQAFFEAMLDEWEPEEDDDVQPKIERVEHCYMRKEISGDLEPGQMYYKYYKEQGRGCFPITLYNIDQQGIDEAWERQKAREALEVEQKAEK